MKAYTITDIHSDKRITVVCQLSHQLETKLADYFVDNFEAEGVMFTRVDSDFSMCGYDAILSVYYPVHLHHDHKTGLTIGAVHAKCNAVLWQYYGE